MITLIQLKQVIRDKRFIFFALVIPVIWYILMVKLPLSGPNVLGHFTLFLIASLIGILGNSIVTFSKRISAGRQYYLTQIRHSRYSIWRYMIDQLIIQSCLNLLIILLITVAGLLLRSLTLDTNFISALGLLLILSVYFSVIGFWFGLTFSSVTINNGSTPLMFGLALMIVPFSGFTHGTFTDVITKVQSILPPYYFYQFFNQLFANQTTSIILLKFGATVLVTLIPFILGIRFKLFNKTVD